MTNYNDVVNSGLKGTTGSGNFVGSNSPTIKGTNNLPVMTFADIPAATDYISVSAGTTGAGFQVVSSGADKSGSYLAKGIGGILIGSVGATTVPTEWQVGANKVSHSVPSLTATRTVTWPDANVTIGSQMPGTTTNDNASTGNIGEFVQSAVAVASAVSLTNGIGANVTSISLTAGDWDVFGTGGFVPQSGTTTITYMIGSISTTSATTGLESQYTQMSGFGLTSIVNFFLPLPTVRLSLASTTTVYLVGQSGFGVGTMKSFGTISARRVR